MVQPLDRANALFVDEDFDGALAQYNAAVAAEPGSGAGGTVLSPQTPPLTTLPRPFRRDPSSLATASLCTSRRAHDVDGGAGGAAQVCSPPRHFRDTSSGALHQLVRGQGEGLRERADGARRAGVEEVGVGAERAGSALWEAD